MGSQGQAKYWRALECQVIRPCDSDNGSDKGRGARPGTLSSACGLAHVTCKSSAQFHQPSVKEVRKSGCVFSYTVLYFKLFFLD